MSAERTLPGAERIFALLQTARARYASDLHLDPANGAALRLNADIERIGVSVEGVEIQRFIELALDRRSLARLERVGVADAVYCDETVGSVRVHASRGPRGPRLAVRLLARTIPELDSLALPAVLRGFIELRSGLLLVVGPTGSGKTTTIASLLDRLNATAQKHIVCFEDPIEYRHHWLRGAITQYEVGRDVSTFAEGVRSALRADPDVLFIGELRDYETVAAGLQAAETGHLVFAAMHTPSETPHAVHRIVGMFPSSEQERARVRFAEALRAVAGLRLVPLRDGSGLRAAVEILVATDTVRRALRDGHIHTLRAAILAGRRDGMQTLEQHLAELVAAGDVDLAVARAASLYPGDLRDGPATPRAR